MRGQEKHTQEKNNGRRKTEEREWGEAEPPGKARWTVTPEVFISLILNQDVATPTPPSAPPLPIHTHSSFSYA